MFLQEEASSTTVYVQNRSPHWILEDKTLEEAFIGVKPEVSHLRILGCPVYFHVPKEKRTKLEPSRKKGTFVGYSETLKVDRIYIPRQRQIEVSRDVAFDEEVAFRRSRGSHMEIDSEEQEASKDMDFSTPDVRPKPVEQVDMPRDVAVIRKRLAWLRDTLLDAAMMLGLGGFVVQVAGTA